MTSRSNVPDEAVEAAHKAWREQAALDGSIFEYNLRAALEAASTHLKAAGLDEAAASIDGGGNISAWLRARAHAVREGRR